MSEEPVLTLSGVDHRYGRRHALRDCSFVLPRGRVAALVGPNGAGKTTLMLLVTGLLKPTAGTVRALGADPGRTGMPAGASFLAQNKPLYPSFRVEEMLRAAAVLNPGPRWDGALAARLVTEAGIEPRLRVRQLSAGMRARVALALALGRRPELLLLDEPLAELDPLARRQVMGTLLVQAAECGTTVLLSSHVLADLEDSCDHLVLLRGGCVQLAGDVDSLLAGHRRVIGPATGVGAPTGPGRAVAHASTTGRQTTALVRGTGAPPGFHSEPPNLEELVLGYLEGTAADREVAA